MAGLFHYLVNWMNFLTVILKNIAFVEKDNLRCVYRWKLLKFFLCEVICGRCELVEFSYDALPIEMDFMQENKSKIMSVDEKEKMLNQLKELLRKRNLDDNLSPRPHLNSIFCDGKQQSSSINLSN